MILKDLTTFQSQFNEYTELRAQENKTMGITLLNGNPVRNASSAESGISALEVLNSNKEIKLIISDLNMPEMDGMDFIKCARELEAFKETPILICTTEICKNLKTEAKKLGVKAWMQKPLQFSKILQVLNLVLAN